MQDGLMLPTFKIPPSQNACYADIVQGRKVWRTLSADGKAYKQYVSMVMDQTGATTQLREYIQEHHTVDVWMYVYKPNWYTKRTGEPNRNAGDADNRVKILQDSIFNCIGVDDCCVFFTGVRKLPSPIGNPDNEFITVVIRPTVEVVDEFG